MALLSERFGLQLRSLGNLLARIHDEKRWVRKLWEDGRALALALSRLREREAVEGAGVGKCGIGRYGADGTEGGGKIGVATVEVDGYGDFSVVSLSKHQDISVGFSRGSGSWHPRDANLN